MANYTAGQKLSATDMNTNIAKLLAARGTTGKWPGCIVYRSNDGGATFTAWSTLPATVVDIIEDPALDNSVFVLAGPHMYQSIGPSASWAVFYAGPSGATARRWSR